jgi:putative ATP-binding cassette transporter
MRLSRGFLKATWQLTRSYWYSKEKWKARALLAVIVGLNLAIVYILVLLNEWNNLFYNSLQNYNRGAFFSALKEFTVLAFFYIVAAVYEQYLRQMLEIKWRRWMTDHYLQNWLYKQTYYRMQLLDSTTDNPDQRISEDLNLFVTATLNLSMGFIKAAMTLVFFMGILWTLSGSASISFIGASLAIPGYMVWAALAYAVCGTWLTAKIGRPLVDINFRQQRFEADFRFNLVRLRENSESIAFYRGEKQEQGGLAQRFQRVFDNFWQLMLRQKKLTWFTSGYSQIAIIFPFIVAAPRYFAKQLQLGGLIQTASAFGRVQDAMSYFVDSYSALAEWQAVVKRLSGFSGNMERIRTLSEQQNIQQQESNGTCLSVSELSISLPNGTTILQNLRLKLALGEALLITGPSGAGKSTLLRTLAGIWPFGEGNIVMPRGHNLLFIPQKVYLPLGTLREAILYPYGADLEFDSDIKAVLALCGLEEFGDRLNRVENWAQIFSLGEQQRIAFARIILHQPQWIFLDEATSALDEEWETKMYRLLQERLRNSTIISIGHRPSLTAFHHCRLQLDGRGNWQWLSE